MRKFKDLKTLGWMLTGFQFTDFVEVWEKDKIQLPKLRTCTLFRGYEGQQSRDPVKVRPTPCRHYNIDP
jgi:hypothetical protein